MTELLLPDALIFDVELLLRFDDDAPVLMFEELFWPEILLVVPLLLCDDEPDTELVPERLESDPVELDEYVDFLEGPMLL